MYWLYSWIILRRLRNMGLKSFLNNTIHLGQKIIGKYQVYNRSCSHCHVQCCTKCSVLLSVRKSLWIYQEKRLKTLQKLGNQSSSITMRCCFLLTNTNPRRMNKQTHTHRAKRTKNKQTKKYVCIEKSQKVRAAAFRIWHYNRIASCMCVCG